MHKDGPRLWDDTLMEAERIATDSKARYLQLPTPDREAEMQRTRSQFFLPLRERLRNTYLSRISKLNPGEPLAWKYISGRKRASLPPPTSLLLGDGQDTYKTARRAANALNRIFFPLHPSHKAVRFSKGIKRQNTSLGIVSSSLFGQQNNNESAAHLLHFLLLLLALSRRTTASLPLHLYLLLALSRRTTTSLPLHLIQFFHSHLVQSHRITAKLPPHLV
ncbi:hypothetical protein ECC02_012653 [Trypanosoma cruzi]|uniref:Uncharacterized protein n=1 Tax=Trypanosoma cruzi TaxID=5693 RepID=A0A7J6XKJ2_TRYCR|nr:hypothetical protein ECC02_012653 [Trypanosoma cruzi]